MEYNKGAWAASHEVMVWTADKVVENKNVKVLWNFNIQVDKFIEAKRPGIIVVRKKKKVCVIIDIAVLGDLGIQIKEDEKIEKYEDLRRDI